MHSHTDIVRLPSYRFYLTQHSAVIFIFQLDYIAFKGKLWIYLHKDAKTGKKGISKLALHFDSLEHGTEAFMQWLCSDDKMSASKNPIILKQFMDNKYTVLYDNTLNHDVIVETHDGVPFCKTCNTDDCGHVGFTILLEQKFENDGSLID